MGPQVGRPDRVRVGDHRGPAILVAADGERQAEGEDQRDHAQKRCLQHPERLSQRLVVLPQAAAQQNAGTGHGRDHREDDQCKNPAAQ